MPRRLLFGLLALVCLTGSAQAGLVIETPSLVVTHQGQSGWFDVNVRYVADVPGPSPEYSVAAFTVNLSISTPGVVFTGIDESTAAPYLLNFPGSTNSGLTLVDPDPIPPGGTTSLTFFDSTSPPDFPGRLMNANDVFGLARVYFTVAPDAHFGDRLLILDPPAPDGVSDLTSSDGVSIIAGVSGGVLSVVPEPSTLVGAAFCGLAGLLAAVRRRRIGSN